MANFNLAIASFSLKSTYTGKIEYEKIETEDGEEEISMRTTYTTPTTASNTVTVDVSGIPKNATITSAVFSGKTNGQGDSYAAANGTKKYITNAFSVDVKEWLSGIPDALQIKFTFKAYGSSGGSGNHVKVCNFTSIALAVEYEVPAEEEADYKQTAPTFVLQSSWEASYKTGTNDEGGTVIWVEYSSPTMGTEFATFDTSSIPDNATIISAILSGNASGNGTKYFLIDGSGFSIDGNFSRDISDRLSPVPDSLTVDFYFQATGGTGEPPSIYKEYASFTDLALSISYTTGAAAESTINILGGECFLCRRRGAL